MTILATGNPNGMVILDDANNMAGEAYDPRQAMVASTKGMLTPVIKTGDRCNLFRINFAKPSGAFWVHFSVWFPSGYSDQIAYIKLYTTSGSRDSARLYLAGHQQAKMLYGMSQATGTVKITPQKLHAVDVFVDIPNSKATWYLDQEKQDMLSIGMITTDILFDGLSFDMRGAGGEVGEILISEEDTRGLRVQTAEVSSAGAVNEWSGDLSAVQGPAINTDFMSTGGANTSQTYKFDPIDPSVSGMVPKALVQAHSSFAKGDAPFPFVKPLIGNGSEIKEGLFQPLGVFANGKQTIYELNPHTGSRWTVDDMQSFEAGMKNVPEDINVTVAQSGIYYGADGGMGSVTGTTPSGDQLLEVIVLNTGDFKIRSTNNHKWNNANSIHVHGIDEAGVIASHVLTWQVNSYRANADTDWNALFSSNVGKTIRIFVEVL